VIQEAFGLTGHIHRVADALAEAGFLALAPTMFHRSEEQVFGYTDYEKLAPVVMSLTQEGITMDVDAAIAELTRLGQAASAQGIIGFCMGGTVALATAARLNLGAAVTFYGGAISEERFGLKSGLANGAELHTPWLGLYGDLDANIPTDEVEQLRGVVAGASVPTEIVRYADADHGFHCDERPSFHAESSSDAWQRTIEFLSEHLHS
jgi:carboxymethylenebutenolidase